ncbi:MAG: V-type ATP synthase subunit F [Candidatus Nanohaloarchaea archaeon]
MEEKKKKQIAVIGKPEFTLGFELAGVTRTYDRENYTEKIKQLVDSDELGILIVDENDLEDLPKRVLQTAEQSVEPVVVPLSETAESERLNEKIKKAIGADITT